MGIGTPTRKRRTLRMGQSFVDVAFVDVAATERSDPAGGCVRGVDGSVMRNELSPRRPGERRTRARVGQRPRIRTTGGVGGTWRSAVAESQRRIGNPVPAFAKHSLLEGC